MAALRTPGTGCPWDLEQNFATIAPYTLEEAYEVADAIARGDLADLREELGDLLLQVVFHARMAQEQGAFDFGDVVEAITEKLCAAIRTCSATRKGSTPERGRRAVGPHQGRGKGRAGRAADRAGARGRARRRAGRPARPHPRAQAAGQGRQGRLRLERSARGAGEDPRGVRRDRSRDRRAASATRRRPRSATCCSPWSTSPAISTPIRRPRCAPPTRKFERRFAAIERALAAQGKTPQDATLAEMDALWDAAKAAEK